MTYDVANKTRMEDVLFGQCNSQRHLPVKGVAANELWNHTVPRPGSHYY